MKKEIVYTDKYALILSDEEIEQELAEIDESE